jgi:hypothetical protein
VVTLTCVRRVVKADRLRDGDGFPLLAALKFHQRQAVASRPCDDTSPLAADDEPAPDDRQPLRDTVCWPGPAAFLNTVGDLTLLPKVLDAANRFVSRPSDEAMDELASRRHLVPLFS